MTIRHANAGSTIETARRKHKVEDDHFQRSTAQRRATTKYESMHERELFTKADDALDAGNLRRRRRPRGVDTS